MSRDPYMACRRCTERGYACADCTVTAEREEYEAHLVERGDAEREERMLAEREER